MNIDPAILYRRRSYIHDGKTLAGFTIPRTNNTYIILAQLQQGKWVPFWSYRVANVDYDDQFLALISKEQTNVAHFYSDEPCTDDHINDQVQELAANL